MVTRIGIVGAGTMGAGIAQEFARAGFTVTLHDTAPAALERATAAIARSLAKFVEKGTLTAPERDATISRITPTTAFAGLASADLAIEAVVEDLETKRTVFRALDATMPAAALLASNTSSISITTLGASTARPDRVLGMHFMNPVPLMPLVEIIRGRSTSAASVQTAFDLCRRLGKTPVEAADAPGFIANRILMPMINEAIFAVMEGVGTPDAIDTVMKLGMHHPMGPLALADLIGLDVCLAIMRVLHEGFADAKYRPCPLLERMVAAGTLGRKTGQGFFTYPTA